MLRSLHIKLVLIMILLVVCLMAIAGAFLINSVNRFYLNEFYTQMVEVFSEDTEFVRDLVTAREGEQDGGEAIDQILLAKMGPLGVDGKNRNYYILDGETAEILASSDDDGAQTLEKLTPNLLIALNEKREGNESDLTANYMDLALPIQRGGQDYIIYILDQRATVRELNSQLFQLIIEALAFGLIISVLLSFLLSRAMVTPIRALTRGAPTGAEGDFGPQDPGGVPRRDRGAHQRLQRHGRPASVHPPGGGQRADQAQHPVPSHDRRGGGLQPERRGHPRQPRCRGDAGHGDSPGGNGYLPGSFLGRSPRWRPSSPWSGTAWRARPSGESARCCSSWRPFDREKQVGVLVVVHDVTQQVKNETMRKEFVANVSHELRTPSPTFAAMPRPCGTRRGTSLWRPPTAFWTSSSRRRTA